MAKIHKTKTRSMGAEGENAQQRIKQMEIEVSMLKDGYFQLKKVKADLAESEARYRLLSENQADVIWAAELENMAGLLDQIHKGHLNAKSLEPKIHPHFTYVNSAIYSARGYTPEEFLKMDIKNTMTPDSYKKFIHVLAENIFHLGKAKPGSGPTCSQSMELEVIRKNGTIFWVEVNLKCNQDAQGQPIGIIGINRDITERRKTAEILGEKEKDMTNILANINDIIFRLSPLGIIQYINPRVQNLYGYDPKELIGKHFKKTTPIYEWHKALDIVKKVMNGKNVRNVGIDQMAKNSSIITAEINASPIIENGKIVGILGVMRDTSERGKVEYARKVSELRYRRLFETAKDGILILDYKTGQIIDANPFIMDILDLPKEKFIGKKLWEMGAFKSIAENKANFLELKRKKYIRYEDLPMKASGGREIDVEFVSNVYNVDGQKVIQCNVRDITDRKLAADSLMKEREWSGNILQSVPNIIVGLGEKSKILLFNKFAENFTGYKVGEVMGKEWIDTFIPKKVRKEIYSVWDKIVKNKLIEHHYLNSIITKNGEEKLISWNNTVLTQDGKFKMVLAVGEDITERKQIEDAMKASEVRYRRLFESAKDGILILDYETGKVVDVNPFLVNLLDFPKEKFIGRQLWELGFFRDIARNKSNYLKLKRKKFIRYENLPMETSKGGKINVEFVSNVYEVSGKSVIQCNIRNITERKKAEEALQESEEKFRTIFEGGADGVVVANIKTRQFVMVNSTICKFLGYKEEELLRMGIPDIHPKASLAWVYKQFTMLSNGTLKVSQNVPLLRKDGLLVYADVAATMLIMNGIKYSIGFFRDSTERNKAENALRESEAKFRAVVEHITDVVFTTDLSGLVTFITPNVSDFGYAPKDIIGRHFMGFIHTDDVERVSAEFKRTTTGGQNIPTEFRMRRKNGSYVVVEEMDDLIMENGKPVHLVGTFHDITERKLAEEELKKKVEQMEFIGRTNLKRHKEMLEMRKEIERLKAKTNKLKD